MDASAIYHWTDVIHLKSPHLPLSWSLLTYLLSASSSWRTNSSLQRTITNTLRGSQTPDWREWKKDEEAILTRQGPRLTLEASGSKWKQVGWGTWLRVPPSISGTKCGILDPLVPKRPKKNLEKSSAFFNKKLKKTSLNRILHSHFPKNNAPS